MKIKVIQKQPMTLTGSRVLRIIQDNYTPPRDLLIRETIQNSQDAIEEGQKYVNIDYRYNEFNIDEFISNLDLDDSSFNEKLLLYYADSNTFLGIKDTNTTGLLGSQIVDEEHPYTNFYNLVYDVMGTKMDTSAGGSWGIGKTVMFRYGKGICFYYTRTFEDNKYINKLAATIIQNEQEECILGTNTLGIAFLGDEVDGQAAPIYDEEIIQKFLNVFGYELFTGDTTGTLIIIPFLKDKLLLESKLNKEESPYKIPWLSDVESSLYNSILKWYFPKINNQTLDKFIRVSINDEYIVLDTVFSKLQELYNGTLEGALEFSIEKNKTNKYRIGTFRYKKFHKSEFEINTPPNNYPELKYIFDTDVEEQYKNNYILMTRKPGMIINYESNNNLYNIDEDTYIVGIFILDDNSTYNGDSVGEYIRKSEGANHGSWKDSLLDEYPNLSRSKPIKHVVSETTRILRDLIEPKKEVEDERVPQTLQRKLAELLLPNSDFGSRATKSSTTPSETKTNNGIFIKSGFNGFDKNGNQVHNFDIKIPNNKYVDVVLGYKVGSKTHSQVELIDFDFRPDCYIMGVSKLSLKNVSNSQYNFTYDELRKSINFKKPKTDKLILKTNGLFDKNEDCYGIRLHNYSDEEVRVNFIVNVGIRERIMKLLFIYKDGDLSE